VKVRAELDVAVAPEVVWSYFADVSRWPEWSPICTEASVEGDRLAMKLRLAGVRLPVTSRIVAREAPHRLAWQTRWPGLRITHEYRFVRRGAGTRMINEEHFDGLALGAGALVRRYFRRRPLDASLRRLRSGVEREVAGAPGA